MEQEKIIIITGLSGSGKSTAIKALEDAGFFCVDNLPVVLLPQFLQLRMGQPAEISNLALVMDIREKGFVSNYADVLDTIRSKGYQFEILFFEASEETLLRRYSQTRRRHPLAREKNLSDGIRAEKEELKGIRAIADKVIDTSYYNVHELRAVILQHVKKVIHSGQPEVHVLSFGFKYGLPHEADLVVDVRFLPNPYFVPELAELDGTSPRVEAFVTKSDETQIFLRKYFELLDFLIPLYQKEGKSYLTIAVGCTGGRHRSIVVAEKIFQYLKGKISLVQLTHRDIELA
ncbi:MAG: RNase adapter RapZ [Deltaproteobacteria bacterium]|nr:RNase adapter RapZ [Deltaproteobacteria bacterium]RLB91248.1 MAG: RNase adapter RapZ [Deltaproteobacteria bacterium]RLB92704.1 MAG: RNase adapter RapZ [Deltaproteobacteria bacterium]